MSILSLIGFCILILLGEVFIRDGRHIPEALDVAVSLTILPNLPGVSFSSPRVRTIIVIYL
jgi:hypothetical protein